MKRLFLFLLCAAAFSACKKEVIKDDGIIVDPPMMRLISSDTLKTGGKMGLNIGQQGSDLYLKIQQLKASGQISYMYVVSNVYTALDALQTKIPLYQSLYLDETVGTGTGVQIYYASNKVESIFSNDGAILSKWPSGVAANATISVGDSRDGIYQKLLNIRNTAYANKLQRISLFSKDLDTIYEAGMNALPQWYFAVKISEKRWEHIQLMFTNGVLTSIYDNIYE
ncbi:hypothetical protein HQ865_20430 [Mucilaginibacter mali]|uniref:Uncharacterized protein n=1 Tax=Mucilaginibacter mali TaxID=2740462 RepID=A0A7D4QVZ8_9SPHI|nr:hypothetical protein [Mucilaginibacter mali]QKJ32029.1 hypothetical protein HQ865_20430 [Mucilaginibacter mali]